MSAKKNNGDGELKSRGLVDFSVGFRTGGTCGHRMLAFYRSVPSFHFLLPTLLPLSCLFSSSSSSFIVPLFFVSGAGGEPQAGSDAASGAGGGHHARDRAGSWGLPPQRPARALPRPGPHAPLLQHATHWIPVCRRYLVSVGGD